MNLARITRYGVAIFLTGIAIAAVCVILRETTDTQLAERHIAQPVPASLQNLQVDKLPCRPPGRKLVFGFRIAAPDVAALCASRSFQRFDWATYYFGSLIWGNTGAGTGDPQKNPYSGINVGSILLYRGSYTPPPWFTLNSWPKPEVYVFRENGDQPDWVHTQVLVYNSASAEACFIEYYGG